MGPIELRSVRRSQDLSLAPEIETSRRPGHRTPPVGKYVSVERLRASDLGISALMDALSGMGPGEVVGLIGRDEARHAAGTRRPWLKQLRSLKAGDEAAVPFDAIVPGQSQISFHHVRDKALDFLKRYAAGEITTREIQHGLMSWLEPELLESSVGPDGQYLQISDGHHKVAAIKLMRALLEETLGEDFGRTGPLFVSLEQEVRSLVAMFGASGMALLKVRVEENCSRLTEDEFQAHLMGHEGEHPRIYLRGRFGDLTARPPDRFSDLEDNPFRCLASDTVLKVRAKKSGSLLRLSLGEHPVSDFPVWIKPADAPEYVEFAIARVYEEALSGARRDYDPDRPVSEEDRELLRSALSAARSDPSHPEYPVLQSIQVVERPICRQDFELASMLGARVDEKRNKPRLRGAAYPLWIAPPGLEVDALLRMAEVVAESRLTNVEPIHPDGSATVLRGLIREKALEARATSSRGDPIRASLIVTRDARAEELEPRIRLDRRNRVRWV